MTKGPGYSILQTINYLRRQKTNGKIVHWEIETNDTKRGMFGVRVATWGEGTKCRTVAVTLFKQRVSATHCGRDLLSAAHRAVAEVTK